MNKPEKNMFLSRNAASHFHGAKWLIAGVMIAGLAGCAVGPNYVRPEMKIPTAFKEEAGWKSAQPRDTTARGKWWEIYGDAPLNTLLDQVQINNFNVQQAEAQYRQARATAQIARAGFYPTVGANAGQTQQNSNTVNPATGTRSTTTTNTSNLTLDASWEPDIWGKVRRSAEAGKANTQASAAELAAALLSAQAELAQNYFSLRIIDAEAELYQHSIADYQRSLQITQNQFAVGIITRADVAQAQTQLLTAQAQAMDLGVQRAQLEHAIAILVGRAPSEFTLAPAALTATLPAVPVSGLPSSLLERRPDIASAERQVAAANANIGIARAAYYPSLNLTASGALQAASMGALFDAPARVWAVGAALSETLFDGGLRHAQNDVAAAAYDAQVAAYKQTVLGALQEVEDNLVALRVLENESDIQDQAVKASKDAATLALNQYKAGTTSYLSVVTAQATALSNERSALQIKGRQYAAHVLLIKALGGSAHEDEQAKNTP